MTYTVHKKHTMTKPTPQALAKRLKAVERRSLQNMPELKSITYSANGTLAAGAVVNIIPTEITEGAGPNERVGDQISLVRVTVRGVVDQDLDSYIVKLYTTSSPVAANFTAGKGAFFLDSETNARFTELTHFRPLYNEGNMKISKRLYGKTYYNGSTSTSGIRNQICFTILNRATASRTYNVTIRLWYRDA